MNIAVRLFPATSPKDVRFHLVDERGRRVHFRRYVAKDGAEQETGEESRSTDLPDRPSDTSATSSGEKEVEYGELMRGYETDEGLVVLDQEEIESVRPSRSRVIEIEDFVDLSDVDPVHFEKSYVLAPQRDAEKPYALLLRAMERAGRVGIGRFVLRTRPHLAAIRPASGALVPGIDEVEVSDRELQLAQRLIDTLKVEWDPARYADCYREELLRRISEKTPVAPREGTAGEIPTGRVEELMAALKASVEKAKKANKNAKKSEKKRSA